MNKKCTNCQKELPADLDHFHRCKSGKYGLASWCKDCTNKKKNKFYSENKQLVNDRNKRWREENKERVRQYQADWYLENKEEKKAKVKERYKKSSNKIKEKNNQWAKDNKEKIKAIKQRRRSRIKQVANDLSIDDWEKILVKFGHSCAYCGLTQEEHIALYGTKLHQDHFIPLQSGGEYTINNIVPACKRCNCSKRQNDFFEWYRKQTYYSWNREKRILINLNY